MRRGVPGANGSADVDVPVTELFERSANPFEGSFKVLLDVVAQRFQRRDVENAHLILEAVSKAALHQLVDGAKERSKRLPRARG